MSLVSFIAVTFGIIGLSFAGISFWALMNPKISCVKINSQECGHNVCIKLKNHTGRHMTCDGKEF